MPTSCIRKLRFEFKKEKSEEPAERAQSEDPVTKSDPKILEPISTKSDDTSTRPVVELLDFNLVSASELKKMREVYHKRTHNGDFIAGFRDGNCYFLSVLDRMMFIFNLHCVDTTFCGGPTLSVKVLEAARLNKDVYRHINTHKKFNRMVLSFFKSSDNDDNGNS